MSITSRPAPTNDVQIAWKSFSQEANGAPLKFPMNELNGSKLVPRGEWIRANQATITVSYDDKLRYPPGFHCFTSKSAVDNYGFGSAKVKVLIKRVRTIGKQGGKVFVADWMYVPAENEVITGTTIKSAT